MTPGITMRLSSVKSVELFIYSGKSSYIGAAIPYMPASPLQINATVFPSRAKSKHALHLSISFFIGVVKNSLLGKCSLTKSIYTVYPTITSAFSIALNASSVIIDLNPGPMPTMYIFPAIFSTNL